MRHSLRTILLASALVGGLTVQPVLAVEPPAPPAPPAAPGSPAPSSPQEVKALQNQLEATRAQLEQLQKQFETLNRNLEESSRKLERIEGKEGSIPAIPELPELPELPEIPGLPDSTLDGLSEDIRDGVMEGVREAMEEARQAKEEARQQASEARDEALREALEAREEAARQLEEIAREMSTTGREGQRELRERLREAQRALRDAERKARFARRAAGRQDMFGESETRSGERLALGSSTIVKAGESVPEMVVLSGDGEIYGEVLGDAVVMAGDLIVHSGGQVRGDAVVLGGKIRLEEGGKIIGEQVQFARGRFPFPLVNQNNQPDADQDVEADVPEEGSSLGKRLRSGFIMYLLLVAGGLLALTFIPRRVDGIARMLESRAVASGVAGALSLLALIPLTLVLVVTLIGIPLVPFVYGGVVIGGLVGITALAQVLGRRIPLRNEGPRTAGGLLIWGLALFVLATRVPVLGVIVGVTGALVGLGAVVLSRFGDREDLA